MQNNASYPHRARRVAPVLLAAVAWCLLAGCVQSAILWAHLTGGEAIKPQFTLTKGPLLILIDDPRGQITEPRAVRELHETLAANFLEFNVNNRVVPFEEWQRLKQTDRDYDRLSSRQIGEKLGADQILQIYVDRFTLRAEPGAPIFKGEFAVRLKVLSTERGTHDVRLWPRESAGRRISAETPPEPIDGDKSASEMAKELSIHLGQKIAKLFYEHREMDR